MRSLERDKQNIWVCRPTGKHEILDDEGYSTGEYVDTFSKPIKYRIGINPTIGDAKFSPYGTTQDLRREMTTTNKNMQIAIGDYVYVDVVPKFDDLGNLKLNDEGIPTVSADYMVTAVMNSQNGSVVRYGITRRV